MPHPPQKYATLVGLVPVLIWGAGLPICRLFQGRTGLLMYLFITFGMSGLIGVITQRVRRESWPSAAIFREPTLYGRALFFALHEALCVAAAGIVSTDHLPLVILLNYFWPTAVILCSIPLTGIRITRMWAFGLGTLTVLGSLTVEMFGGATDIAKITSSWMDAVAYTLAFVGAISWGLYSALSRRSGERSGGGKVVPFFQLCLAMLALVGTLFYTEAAGQLLLAEDLMAITLYSLFLWLSYLAWDFSMRHGNIVYISLFADFIPWLSLITASLVIGSPITPLTVVSAVTLVAGAMLTRYGTIAPIESDR